MLANLGCDHGEIEAQEECDDGNEDNTDGCTNLCLRARCGDGHVQEDEESCDADGGDASCSADGDADEGWPRRMRLAGSSLSTTAILLLLQYWWAKSCFLDGWR